MGLAVASPITYPYPASLPHSTYGEPISPAQAFLAPEGPPAILIQPNSEEYTLPTYVGPILPPPPLPELPQLPEFVIPHFPEAPKEIAAALPIATAFNAPPIPAAEYSLPPIIKESKPIAIEIPETPSEEYGPPQTSFIPPPAPALPELPQLPETIITHFPEAPPEIAAALPIATLLNAPNETPAQEYGLPPIIKESKPIAIEIPEKPTEEYKPPQAAFIPPPAPSLPELPQLPESIVTHIPDTPPSFQAALPVATVFDAPYPPPVPAEQYGPPSTQPPITTTSTTTLSPPTTLPTPTGPYPAAVPNSHYGDPIQKSTPFFIR